MRKISVILLMLFISGIVYGQKNLPENMYYQKLANGLDVLVVEDPTVPLVTIELCVKNGAITETPEYDGLSHLYEHMFFKANRDYPSQEAYLERVNELGIVFNGTTSTERVNYFITLSSKYLKEGLQFMNSAIRYPVFDPEEMAKENLVVDGEFERNESNPFFFLQKAVARRMWKENYSRKNTIGDHEVIKTATPEKMQIIKEKYYHPNNTILAVAGDVDAPSVFELARTIYGDWEHPGFDPFMRWPIPEFRPIEYSGQVIVENENARVPVFMLQWFGPDTRHDIPATYAADVFSYILSQKSSKLNKALVESGLAYQVNVGYQTLKYVGPIYIYMVPNPQRIKEAYDTLMAHIERWGTDPDYFTDKQMETAKTLLTIDDAYSREKTSEFIHTLTYWWASASIDYYTTYLDKIKEVTREDIQRYIQRYIHNKNYYAGLLISPEMRKMLQVDSFFTETLEPVEAYTFHFKENSAEFADSTEEWKLNSLIQWMKINPQVRLQLNGHADKSELLEIRDKAILEFLKANPDFELHPRDLALKKTVRLDLLRALTIAKRLVDAGIPVERLSGSGRVEKGADKKEAEESRKVVAMAVKV